MEPSTDMSGRERTCARDDARAPKLVGSTTSGGDWTWSHAYDDGRAISFDPASTLAALPITTIVRGSNRSSTAGGSIGSTAVGMLWTVRSAEAPSSQPSASEQSS